MRNKILFVLHLPPPVHGAAMVGQFIRENEYINSAIDGYYINLSTSISVDDIGKGGWKKLFRYSGIVGRTLYRAIVFRPDVVYVTMAAKGGGFYKDAFLVILLKLMGKRTVFHFHNKGIRDHRHQKHYNFLYKRVFRNSSVILLSENLKEDVEAYVDEKRIYYCPNGIHPIPEDKAIAESIFRVPTILFIGNLAESKGIVDLIDALRGLHERGMAFECKIVGGEGTMSKEELLLKISESGLDESVKYLGRVIGNDKDQLLREANLLVHPSHEECFPLVLLEAMSAALPVISTREGGIPDIVLHNETGFLVEKKNVSELQERIAELLENASLRAKFGANGKIRFTQRFTTKQFEQQFTAILKEIISENERN